MRTRKQAIELIENNLDRLIERYNNNEISYDEFNTIKKQGTDRLSQLKKMTDKQYENYTP